MKASVGVKRLLMYALILLCILFVGFLAYFFARNDEQITFTIEEGSVIYKNKGDEFALPIVHEDAHSDTTISVTITNAEVLIYSEPTATFKAMSGGMASVTITPSNDDFGPYRFDIMVGDGSVSNPWYVSDAISLANIGRSTDEGAWLITDSYEMINDINLENSYTEEKPYFEPIGTKANPFAGNFNGNGYVIENLKINGDYAQVGLFGVVSAYGNVEGVRLENFEIVSNGLDASVGSIAGINYGTVSRIIAKGTINSAQASVVGGIVGINDYATGSATVSNVSATVDFSGTYSYLGGVVGMNNAGVLFNTKAYINVDITSLTNYFGGVLGENNANTLGEYGYTRPIVKNNYAIIETTNTTQNSGIIIGKNNETANSYVETNKYVSNYGYSASITALCANGKTANDSEMKAVSKDELQSDALFVGWDFNGAWEMVVYPEINIEAPADYHGEYIPGSALTNENDVKNALNTMFSNPNSNVTYTINTGNTIEIDCYELKSNNPWTPIGTAEQPFNCKLIVENGTTLIFKNIQFADGAEYVGFFGVMQDAYVSNITFKDIKANGVETGKVAGGIVNQMINSTLDKCVVDGVMLKNYEVAGFIAGTTNNSSIKNCSVVLTNLDLENAIYNTFALNIYYGGIAGTTYNSTVSNCSVDMAIIKSDIANANAYIGGIVGNISNSTISYGSNIGLNINSSQAFGYYGGIAGATTGKSVVEKSYNLGKIEISANNYSEAGGLVGNNSAESTVRTSFSKTPKVQAKNVGGLVAYNSGVITECYSDGEYIGYDIGGLASTNVGSIYNCYTLASVVGIGTSENAAAGLVAFLPKGGNVTLCFSTATISGDDCKRFAETSARIRYTGFENFFDKLLGGYEPGSLNNCVVVNYGDAVVQNKLIFGSNNSWKECTDDDCRGLTGNNPFEQAEFNTKAIGIWSYPIGEYPTLVNCVTEPVA